MEFSDLLTNPWTVGIGSSIAAVGVAYAISILVRQMRSQLGAFSGQYLALTGDPLYGVILVEDIKCRHTSDHLSGTILGVATLELDYVTLKTTKILENRGEYRFQGFVDNRLFVISYRTTIRGVQSAGSIALKSDSTGRIFSGAWVGLVNDDIRSDVCTWVRLEKPVSSKSQREVFISLAERYLASLRGVSNSNMGKGYIAALGIGRFIDSIAFIQKPSFDSKKRRK